MTDEKIVEELEKVIRKQCNQDTLECDFEGLAYTLLPKVKEIALDMEKRHKKYILKMVKDLYDTNLALTKRINSKENPSTEGLTTEQVKMLCDYIISDNTGSYRYLIYTALKGVAYGDGMAMGLLNLNNWLHTDPIAKRCNWYHGNHATPDLTKCSKCPEKSYCPGRKLMLKENRKLNKGLEKWEEK